MGLLTIDQSKCKQDRFCVMDCIRHIIHMDEGGFPYTDPAEEANCLVCGHCVAICPHGALSLSHMPLEECPEIDPALTLNWDQAVQFLRSRRSFRIFKDQEVDQETLTRLIETARYAPTASNSQTIHWTVFAGRERLREFSAVTVDWMRGVIKAHPGSPQADYFEPIVKRWDQGLDVILRTAPNLIIASAPKEASNGLVDSTIALTYLELAALPLGLGTCWAGLLQGAMLNRPDLMEMIGLPQGHTNHYPMMIGYPKVRYHRLPQRNKPPIHWK